MLFISLWGVPSETLACHNLLDEWMGKMAAFGFKGIEASLTDLCYPGPYHRLIMSLLKKHSLSLIVGIYTSNQDYQDNGLGNCRAQDKSITGPFTLEERETEISSAFASSHNEITLHLQQFENQLAIALSLNPIHINVHSGSDTFSMTEATEYLAGVFSIQSRLLLAHQSTLQDTSHGSNRLSIRPTISHETHRGRIFASPWQTARLAAIFPHLRLTLDLSHWIFVAERALSIEWMAPLLTRVDHVHARIGSPQCAQLSHPACRLSPLPLQNAHAAKALHAEKEFQAYFENVWREVVKTKCDKKESILWTPEYGPIQDLYMSRHSAITSVSGIILSEAKRLAPLFNEPMPDNGFLVEHVFHPEEPVNSRTEPTHPDQTSEMQNSPTHILIGITGSVATIKLPLLLSSLRAQFRHRGCDIKIVATEHATSFLPASLEYNRSSVTAEELDYVQNVDYKEILRDRHEWADPGWEKKGDLIPHIDLADWADIVLVAPMDANTLAKVASGICDNLLTCLIRVFVSSLVYPEPSLAPSEGGSIAKKKRMLIAPAMNTRMYIHPLNGVHLATLQSWGVEVVAPIVKTLACGESGLGAMADVHDIALKTLGLKN